MEEWEGIVEMAIAVSCLHEPLSVTAFQKQLVLTHPPALSFMGMHLGFCELFATEWCNFYIPNGLAVFIHFSIFPSVKNHTNILKASPCSTN